MPGVNVEPCDDIRACSTGWSTQFLAVWISAVYLAAAALSYWALSGVLNVVPVALISIIGTPTKNNFRKMHCTKVHSCSACMASCLQSNRRLQVE